MKYRDLIIEKKEYVLLKRLMNLSGYYRDDSLRKSIRKLAGELESADIRDEIAMPKDVIRFNSTISITAKNGWEKEFKLVMPNESDVKHDKISILTPMGAAIIGYAKGDSLVWEFPSGEQELTIDKVVQENSYLSLNMIL